MSQLPESRLLQARPAWSLQKRLVLAFGVLLILFLGLAGFVLDRAYTQSVEAAVAERLRLQIYALLGVAEPDGAGFFVPDLEDARFAQIDSGLYGFILDSSGQEVWRSPSALNLNPDAAMLLEQVQDVGSMGFGTLSLDLQGDLVWSSYGTYWELQDQIFSFVVLESTTPAAAEIDEFRSNLYLWFGAMALVLSAAQYGLLRWGMRPLQRLARDVSAVERGAQEQLQGAYPSELAAVTQNLNLLIRSERERQARYRSTLGDLAHSLKTPLAVLDSSLQESREQGQLAPQQLEDMQEQLLRMNEIVSWQLKRAVQLNQVQVLAKPVPVEALLQRLLGALGKVYRDKHMQVETRIEAAARFLGEESDLMELCGNLLDNAFKYGRSRVQVSVRQTADQLSIEIDDDGAGIAESDREWVLQRGARADTVASGQGIGLAVAVDIVSAYGGEMKVGRSVLGGASFHVSFAQQLP
jgi:two-component system, OmpR family, sensor histidine kinase PhoQ